MLVADEFARGMNAGHAMRSAAAAHSRYSPFGDGLDGGCFAGKSALRPHPRRRYAINRLAQLLHWGNFDDCTGWI
jgi:hypothetical protein